VSAKEAKMENVTNAPVAPIVAAAQILERRREGYVKALDAVPVPKGKSVDFPYASLEQAAKDGFVQLGGAEEAFKFLVKGFKTVAWRKRAEGNRTVRDAVAEGDLTVLKVKRTRKPKAVKPVETTPEVQA
jgi:hypothetical protein